MLATGIQSLYCADEHVSRREPAWSAGNAMMSTGMRMEEDEGVESEVGKNGKAGRGMSKACLCHMKHGRRLPSISAVAPRRTQSGRPLCFRPSRHCRETMDAGGISSRFASEKSIQEAQERRKEGEFE